VAIKIEAQELVAGALRFSVPFRFVALLCPDYRGQASASGIRREIAS